MNEGIGLAGADHGQVVGARSRVGEQVRDPDAAVSILLETALGAEQTGFALDELTLRRAKALGHRLPVEPVQPRLLVECFQVTWSAGHEQNYHGFGLGGKVRGMPGEWICRSATSPRLGEERTKSDGAEAAERIGQELSPASCGFAMGAHKTNSHTRKR